MVRKRTSRRAQEREARQLVRDREKLAALVPGGSAERPIVVTSAAVIEVRANAQKCPQCDGWYSIDEHAAPSAGLRRVDVTCRQCHVSRSLWFRIVIDAPN